VEDFAKTSNDKSLLGVNKSININFKKSKHLFLRDEDQSPDDDRPAEKVLGLRVAAPAKAGRNL